MAAPYLSQDNGAYRGNYYSLLRETIRNVFRFVEESMIISNTFSCKSHCRKSKTPRAI